MTQPEIQLRDGSITLDPRLDRIVQFDDASRNYQVRELLDDPATRRDDKGKAHLPAVTLNQRGEGQCVLDCCVGLRDGSPHRIKPPITDFETRRGMYHQLQHDDPWPGCSLGPRCPVEPSPNAYGGTSVLAGAKYGKANGWWTEYRWIGAGSGRLEDDLIDTLRLIGEIGFGIPWLEGMYETSPSGLLMIEGSKVGGHAIKGFEWAPRQRMPQHWKGTRPGVWLHNTWGPQVNEPDPSNVGGFGVRRRGVTGCAFVELDPLLSLLDGGRGEGMVPIKKEIA